MTGTTSPPAPVPSPGPAARVPRSPPSAGIPVRAGYRTPAACSNALQPSTTSALCTLAAAWIAHQRSEGVRKTYSTNFRILEPYLREHGIHPLTVGFLAADAFARHLETAPTLTWRDGSRAPEGPPQGRPRHNVLASCSSFYEYLLKSRALPKEVLDANPFWGVLYPVVDPLETTTVSLIETEWVTLLATARETPVSPAMAKRTYVLLWFIYVCFLRIDAALTARIENIDYTDGYRTIRARIKGGKWATKTLPPPLYAVITELIGGRTEGFVFTTGTGRPLDEPSVRRTLRKLALRAGLPQPTGFAPLHQAHSDRARLRPPWP